VALSDAVLAIVEDMEKTVQTVPVSPEKVWEIIIRSWTQQLRIAIKASAGSEKNLGLGTLLNPQAQHQAMIEKAREEFRGSKKRTEAEEGLGMVMTELVGFPVMDGVPTSIAIPPDTPFGAKTSINGMVFVYGEDRKLHFSREETEKQSRQRG
jgi:hypothetical protein